VVSHCTPKMGIQKRRSARSCGLVAGKRLSTICGRLLFIEGSAVGRRFHSATEPESCEYNPFPRRPIFPRLDKGPAKYTQLLRRKASSPGRPTSQLLAFESLLLSDLSLLLELPSASPAQSPPQLTDIFGTRLTINNSVILVSWCKSNNNNNMIAF